MAYGDRYDSKMSRDETKRAILEDLKEAVAKGEIAGAFTARWHGYKSLTLTIKGAAFPLVALERLKLDLAIGSKEFVPEFRAPRETAAATALREAVESIANRYNFDHSDSQTDYFHVNFYLTVAFADWHAEREAMIHGASASRRGIETSLSDSFKALSDKLIEEGKIEKPLVSPVGDAVWNARRFDKAMGKHSQGEVGPLERKIRDLQAIPEDWSDEHARAAQIVAVASRSKVTKKPRVILRAAIEAVAS